MPPLAAKRFEFEKPSDVEEQTRREVATLSREVWTRANDLRPALKDNRKNGKKDPETPKANYQLKGQPDNERTRAWLTREPGSDTVHLWTDRILLGDNETLGDTGTPIPESAYWHAAIRDYEVETPDSHFVNDWERKDNLLEIVDTLVKIEEATKETHLALARAATASLDIVPGIGWPKY